MWIFGYGSIIWKPEFPYREQRAGYVEGWTRRFYQHSTDHRGVPGNPGRVATLVESDDGRCWGVAYRIPTAKTETVIDQLDHRERGGYSREVVDVVCPSCEVGEPAVESAVMYVAGRENPNWAGPAPVESLAEQIVRAEGPSGHNVEYLLELAEALREIEANDPHVFELEREVRERLGHR
ncbi:MAG: gamma-glutamylcyclotransferase [Bradymonadaceae bacterium]